eukprot:EG_transcript_36333
MDRGKKQPTSKKVRKPSENEVEAKEEGDYDIWDELLAGTARSANVPKAKEKTAKFRPHSSACTEHKCECGAVTELGPPSVPAPMPLRNHPSDHPSSAMAYDADTMRLNEQFMRLVCMRYRELDANSTAPSGYSFPAPSPAPSAHP